MQRYAVVQFDEDTYEVVDLQEQREFCTCADYDDEVDAKERAERIVALLNKSENNTD